MLPKSPKIIFVFVFSILALLSACKENSTGPNGTQKVYVPTTIGSWWIYFNYAIDSAGNKLAETEYYDTSRIVGTQTISGKTAILMESRNSQGWADTMFFAYENGKLYTFTNLYNNDIVNFDEPQWVILADFNSSNWNIIPDTTFPPVDVPIADVGTAKLTLTFSVNGSKGTQKNITVKGKSIASQEILNTLTMKMKFEVPGIPLPFTTTTNIVMHLWFGENTGLVLSHTDPASIDIVLTKYWIGGHHQELIDYYIAP